MATSRELTWEQVRQAMLPMMRVDHRAALSHIVREYLGLAAVLGGCGWLWRTWSAGGIETGIFATLAALGVLLVGAFQHRLSGLAHDASHYALFRNRLVNDLASDLLLLFPLMAATQRYREAHLSHHQHVNDPERDADLKRLRTFDRRAFPMAKGTFWMRYVLRSLWPLALLRYLFGRAKAANLGEGGKTLKAPYRFRVARCMRGAYWLSLIAAIHFTGNWPVFLLFWVVPLLTSYPALMLLREIAHHSNAPDDGDLTNSRVFVVNPLLRFAVFPHGQAFHLTHHLFALVPHYRLAEAHDLLRQWPPYRDQVVICRGYFFRTWGTAGPSILDVLSARANAPARGPEMRIDAGSRAPAPHWNARASDPNAVDIAEHRPAPPRPRPRTWNE